LSEATLPFSKKVLFLIICSILCFLGTLFSFGYLDFYKFLSYLKAFFFMLSLLLSMRIVVNITLNLIFNYNNVMEIAPASIYLFYLLLTPFFSLFVVLFYLIWKKKMSFYFIMKAYYVSLTKMNLTSFLLILSAFFVITLISHGSIDFVPPEITFLFFGIEVEPKVCTGFGAGKVLCNKPLFHSAKYLVQQKNDLLLEQLKIHMV